MRDSFVNITVKSWFGVQYSHQYEMTGPDFTGFSLNSQNVPDQVFTLL